MTSVANKAEVTRVVFDACKYGMTAPLTGLPMRKATALLTNMPSVVREFRGQRCECFGDHQPIRGFQGGVLLSQYASEYPEKMVLALVQCAREHSQFLAR